MFVQPVHPNLQNRIVCYWFIRGNGLPEGTKALPDGYSDIMINLGGPYMVSFNGTLPQQVNGSVLFGQRTQYLSILQPGEINMIGVRLVPGQEFAFTGQPASTLVNTFIPLTALNHTISETEEQLRKQPDQQEQLVMVENMLLQLLRHQKKGSAEMEKLLADLVKNKGQNTIEHTTSTYKQAERYFKKHLGIAPKKYARICRFYHAYTQVRGKQQVDWMSVLTHCGYYDQSHFIKDFTCFTGLTPNRQQVQKNTIDELFNFR